MCCMWERVDPLRDNRRFWTPLWQKTLKNIVAKEKIAHDEQFLLLPQCFQLTSLITLFNYRDSSFCEDVFKVIFCRFVVCGK